MQTRQAKRFTLTDNSHKKNLLKRALSEQGLRGLAYFPTVVRNQHCTIVAELAQFQKQHLGCLHSPFSSLNGQSPNTVSAQWIKAGSRQNGSQYLETSHSC